MSPVCIFATAPVNMVSIMLLLCADWAPALSGSRASNAATMRINFFIPIYMYKNSAFLELFGYFCVYIF